MELFAFPLRTVETTSICIKILFHHPGLHHHHSDIWKNPKTDTHEGTLLVMDEKESSLLKFGSIKF